MQHVGNFIHTSICYSMTNTKNVVNHKDEEEIVENLFLMHIIQDNKFNGFPELFVFMIAL